MSRARGSSSHDKCRSHSFDRPGIHFHSARSAPDWTPDPRSRGRMRASVPRTRRGTSHLRTSAPMGKHCRRRHSWQSRLRNPRTTCRMALGQTGTACDSSHQRIPSRHHRLGRNDRNLPSPTEGSRRLNCTQPFQMGNCAHKSRTYMPAHPYTADRTRRSYQHRTAGLRTRRHRQFVVLHTVRSTHPWRMPAHSCRPAHRPRNVGHWTGD